MKRIPLSRGLFALVDDADFEWLSQWRWSSKAQGRGEALQFRAVRTEQCETKQRCIYMHREIATPTADETVDHRDGNPLNNQRSNLRVCTQALNLANRRAIVGKTLSRFKGVYWHKGAQKWMAMIKARYLGLHLTEEAAARAYDEAAIEMYGEFAFLNLAGGR